MEADKAEDDSGDRQTTPRSSLPPPFGAKAIKRQRSRTGTGTRPSTARQGNVVRSVFQSRPGTGGSAYLSTAPVSVYRHKCAVLLTEFCRPAHQYHLRIYGADGSWMTMAFTPTTSTQEMLHTLAAKTHLTKGAMKLYVRERGQGEQINSPDIVMLTAADRSPFTLSLIHI